MNLRSLILLVFVEKSRLLQMSVFKQAANYTSSCPTLLSGTLRVTSASNQWLCYLFYIYGADVTAAWMANPSSWQAKSLCAKVADTPLSEIAASRRDTTTSATSRCRLLFLLINPRDFVVGSSRSRIHCAFIFTPQISRSALLHPFTSWICVSVSPRIGGSQLTVERTFTRRAS
jgi:hypothetical protein